MARRKTATQVLGEKLEAHKETESTVKAIEVHGATKLVDFELGSEQDYNTRAMQELVKGAFVRVRVPEGTTDVNVDMLKKTFTRFGAIAVRVLPRREKKVVLESTSPAPHTTIRATVEKMAEEANSKSPAKLKQLVQAVLGEVGL